ncbi:hypothetical protein [Gemmatimonas aurantiaca]|uniref:hypothetical protein n=1 Tax=Gemmatimonas aurantiaca TaxID=173480 RepID=UPI00301D11E2
MRKSSIARWLALFMGAWLSLVQSDAGLFHACTVGSNHGAHGAMPQASHHPASHGNQGGHADHGSTSRGAPQSNDQQSTDQECHCIGHCCATVVPSLNTPDAYPMASVIRIAAVLPGRASHDVMAEWVDFVLPFPTAPPVVA